MSDVTPPIFLDVQTLLWAFYGAAFVSLPHETDFTVGTSVVALASYRGLQRVGVLISNTGTVNVAVSYNAAVTISTGVLLTQGGTFYSDWYYDGDLISRPLYVIAASAGATVHMIERFLVGA